MDNDRGPSIGHPDTEDHPPGNGLMLSLDVQDLIITITTQSAANEPGWELGVEQQRTG